MQNRDPSYKEKNILFQCSIHVNNHVKINRSCKTHKNAHIKIHINEASGCHISWEINGK